VGLGVTSPEPRQRPRLDSTGPPEREVCSDLDGLVIDSLQPDIEIETEVAAAHGARLRRWDGSPSQLAEADFVLHVRTRLDAEFLAALTRCRVIGRFGTGLDSVDLEAARNLGMDVVGVPDYATEQVAQHALALALAVGRGLGSLGGHPPRDAWRKLTQVPALGISGPVGIVGFGAIGAAAARMFGGLGFEVIVHTVPAADETIRDMGFEPVGDLDSLLAHSEVVSLHAALGPSTRHLLGSAQLALLPANAIVVNTGRAGLVDPEALIDSLERGHLRGAGIDAFEGDDGARLWQMLIERPELNVVTTPHIAWCSPASIDRLRREAVLRVMTAIGAANVADESNGD